LADAGSSRPRHASRSTPARGSRTADTDTHDVRNLLRPPQRMHAHACTRAHLVWPMPRRVLLALHGVGGVGLGGRAQPDVQLLQHRQVAQVRRSSDAGHPGRAHREQAAPHLLHRLRVGTAAARGERRQRACLAGERGAQRAGGG